MELLKASIKNFLKLRSYRVYLFLFLHLMISVAVYGQSIRTEEDVQHIAQEFLLKEQSNPPKIIPKNDEPLVSTNKARGLNLGKIQSISDDDGRILAYVQELEPQGFVIVSGDSDMKPILGFSFNGKIPVENNKNNPFLNFVIADIKARKLHLLFDKISNIQTTALTQWGPWLETTWTQREHWNDKCPYLVRFVPGSRRRVGCVATAMAQIVNYWEYPKSVEFSEDEYIYISDTNYYLDDATDWGIPSLAELRSNMSSLSYNGNPDEEAYLSFAAGVKLHMDYGGGLNPQSAANTFTVGEALNNYFDFGSAESYTQRSGVWFLHSSNITDDIKNGRPVQIAVHKSGIPGGHSIVVDGWRDDGFFHLNYGWGAYAPDSISKTWYDIPTTMPGYDVVHTVVYRIEKYLGWNQIGSDQRNSYHAIYSAPSEQPERKWQVNIPEELKDLGTSYSFSHLIIGTGGRIYASISPSDLGSIYHPYIAIYDKYGTLEKLIEVTHSNVKIRYLSQNLKGEVFFSSGTGGPTASDSRVYKLNPNTEEITPIFSHDNPDAGIFEQPIKIDSNDYLYFVIEPRYTANYAKFYSITKDGTIRWSYSFSSSAHFYKTIPAIDEDRNRVYLNYYNSDTEKSHLIAFRRDNGSVVFHRELPTSTHYSSAMAGAPSISEDGTVYVGAYTTLFAYLNDGTKLWDASFSPAYANRTPAIGRDGTLYVNYGKQVGGNWQPGYIRALDPSNGNTKWELALPLNENDLMREVYASANDMVVYSYRKNEVWYLGGVKENGSTYGDTWDMEGGGTIAFGPGCTIISIPPGHENSIWVFSGQGERGDPEGKGMDYADNHPPLEPSNPFPANGSIDQDTMSIVLSWSVGDPDGHDLKYDVYIVALTEGEEGAFVPLATQLTENSYSLTDLQNSTHYLWSIVATDGQSITEGPVWSFSTSGDSASIDENDNLPQKYKLAQNYPNPFNSSTLISFAIPHNSKVSLNVYNTLGQKIATLVEGKLPAGYYESRWDATVSSGIYFYCLEAVSDNNPSVRFTEKKKMILLR